MHKKGVTGHCIMKNGDEFTFEIDDIYQEHYILKITSGEHKGKYSYLDEGKIDDSIVFDKPKNK